jgi:hypothetical protein
MLCCPSAEEMEQIMGIAAQGGISDASHALLIEVSIDPLTSRPVCATTRNGLCALLSPCCGVTRNLTGAPAPTGIETLERCHR